MNIFNNYKEYALPFASMAMIAFGNEQVAHFGWLVLFFLIGVGMRNYNG